MYMHIFIYVYVYIRICLCQTNRQRQQFNSQHKPNRRQQSRRALQPREMSTIVTTLVCGWWVCERAHVCVSVCVNVRGCVGVWVWVLVCVWVTCVFVYAHVCVCVYVCVGV